MKPKRLKVCVLMATYNGEAFLLEQLDSIAHQDYACWELVILDDFSTDRTWELLNAYQRNNPELLITLRKNETNNGPKSTFHKLILNAPEADMYCFADQDDYWLKENMSVHVSSYQGANKDRSAPYVSFSDPLIVSTRGGLIDASKAAPLVTLSETQRTPIPKLIKKTGYLAAINVVAGCSMFVNREALKFYRKLVLESVCYHDHMFAVIASKHGELFFIDKRMVLYRQHSLNAEGAKNINLGYFVRRALDYRNSMRHDKFLLQTVALRMSDKKDYFLSKLWFNVVRLIGKA